MTISAKIIKDSRSEAGVRLTTFELRYPRFVHAEFMTHRQFSRNASSSRAIPITKLIDDVINDPAIPVRWGLNGRGMQDHGVMSSIGQHSALSAWLNARDAAVVQAKIMLELPEVPHKQIVNRILEPFSHITVVMTATEINNFFHLRRHPDAQPEIKELADRMFEAHEGSTPALCDYRMWHLPYVMADDVDAAVHYVLKELEERQPSGMLDPEKYIDARSIAICQKMSVARCARVSYLTHDGKTPDIVADILLHDRLVSEAPMHASPAEHQATPDRLAMPIPGHFGWQHFREHGNLVGWRQYRKMLVGECADTHGGLLHRNAKSNVVGLTARNKGEYAGA